MSNVENNYPSFLQSAGMLFIILCCMGGMRVMFPYMLPVLGKPLSVFVFYGTAMSASLAIILYFGKKTFSSKTFGVAKIDPLVLLLLMIAMLVLEHGLIYPISALIPKSEALKASFVEMFSDISIWSFITIVFLAPIFEELLFRGIMLQGLLKHSRPWPAILFSSFLFAFFHLNIVQLFSAFVGGVFFGWVYWKSKNVWYAMWLHLVVNLSGLLLFMIYSAEWLFEVSPIEFYGSQTKMITAIVISVLVFLISTYGLNKRLGKE